MPWPVGRATSNLLMSENDHPLTAAVASDRLNSPIVVVPLTPDWFPALRACATAVWHAAYDDLLPPGQVDHMLANRLRAEALESYLAAADRWLDLALGADHSVIGYSSCRLVPEDGMLLLEQIYVHPDYWGGTAADALWSVVRQHACDSGCTTIQLRVNRGNSRAQRYYRKRGFTVTGEIVQDIGGGYVMDDYIFTAPVQTERAPA